MAKYLLRPSTFPATMHFLHILRQHLLQRIFTILPTSFFLKIVAPFSYISWRFETFQRLQCNVDCWWHNKRLIPGHFQYQVLPKTSLFRKNGLHQIYRRETAVIWNYWNGLKISTLILSSRMQRQMDSRKTQTFTHNVIFSTCHFRQIQLSNPLNTTWAVPCFSCFLKEDHLVAGLSGGFKVSMSLDHL